MNGVELFLLGRTLMKLGEQAMPAPPGTSVGGTHSVLVALSDLVQHPGTTVGEIAARTGLPQSQVSTAVARLKEAGSIVTAPDPADRRRLLIDRAPEVSDRVREVRASSVDDTLAAALGTDDPAVRQRISDALDLLARHLTPQAVARLRT